MRKVIILWIIVLIQSLVYGQTTADDKKLENIISPPPEASSLIDGYRAKMNNYRGELEHSIPIWDVQAGDLTIRIELNYNSNGNKVQNRASRVGLGWNVFAGGMISRTIRGYRDESYLGFLNCHKCNELFDSDFETRQRVAEKYINEYYGPVYENLDMDPDLYHFNFLGFSGSFIIDNSSYKALVQNNQEFEVELIFSEKVGLTKQVSKIIITDNGGNKYYFGKSKNNDRTAYEKFVEGILDQYNTGSGYIISVNNESSYSNALVGWGLLEIELINKEKITFNYDYQNVTYKDIVSVKVIDNTESRINYRTVTAQESVLKEIVYPQGKVSFLYDSQNREDLIGSKALKNIKIFDNNNFLIQDHRVNYYYTEHANRSNIIPPLQLDTPSFKRMMLQNVERWNVLSNQYETEYTFVYNTDALPSLHSSSKDLWGYFNNAANNFQYDNLINDRRVNKSYTQASLLTTTKLKTGGSISFKYESNDFIRPKYYDRLYIKGLDYVNAVEPDEEQEVRVGMFKDEDKFFNNSYFKTSFTIVEPAIPHEIEGNKVYVEAYLSIIGCNEQLNNLGCKYKKAGIYRSDGTMVQVLNLGISGGYLSPGNYELRVYPRGEIRFDGFYENEEFMVNLKWKKPTELIGENFEEMIGPGNRVAEISRIDEKNKIQEHIKFSYKDENGITTGKIFSIPGYLTITQIFQGGILQLKGPQICYQLQPCEDLSKYYGFDTGDYGYGSIIETNNYSQIKRSYTTYQDVGPYYIFPFHLSVDLSWTRGKLLKEEAYKKDGNKWELVKTTENKFIFYGENIHPFPWELGNDLGSFIPKMGYEELTDLSDRTFPVYFISNKKTIFPIYQFRKYIDYNNPGIVEKDWVFGNVDVGQYRRSYFVAGTMNISERTITDYDGKNTLVHKEYFKYNSSKHNQLTEKRTLTANSREYKEVYKYAPDVISNPIAAGMAKQNILDVYLEKESFLNEIRIQKVLNIFKNIGNNVFKTSSISLTKGLGNSQEKYRYSYDSLGNVVEKIEDDVKITTLLWGYDKQYPIAQFENCTKEQLATALGVSVANLHTIDETKLSQINNLREHISFKEVMITTYEYKPLVGVTKMTDPLGLVINYKYDSMNRLQQVKDVDGNVLEEYEYNYHNN